MKNLVVGLLLLCIPNTLFSQGVSQEGHHFIFDVTHFGRIEHSKVYISSSYHSCVQLKAPWAGVDSSFTIVADTMYKIDLDSLLNHWWPTYFVGDSLRHSNYAEITSTHPIIVYHESGISHDLSRMNLLPVDHSGKEHSVLHGIYQSWNGGYNSSINITGLADSTSVEIIPNQALFQGNFSSSIWADSLGRNISLSKGESVNFRLYTLNDSNGYPLDVGGLNTTQLNSNHPIGVSVWDAGGVWWDSLAVTPCEVTFPNGAPPGNYQYMLPPKNTNGTCFALVPFNPDNLDYFNLIADENNSEIFVDGVLVSTLNKGERYHFRFDQPIVVSSSKPVRLGHYILKGSNCLDWLEPAANGMISSDTSQFIRKCIVPTSGFDQLDSSSLTAADFVTIIVLTVDTGEVFIDQQPIDSNWTIFPGSVDFAFTTLRLSQLQSTISSTNKFQAIHWPVAYHLDSSYWYLSSWIHNSYMHSIPGMDLYPKSDEPLYSIDGIEFSHWGTDTLEICQNEVLALAASPIVRSNWSWTTFTQSVNSLTDTVELRADSLGLQPIFASPDQECLSKDTLWINVRKSPLQTFTTQTQFDCDGLGIICTAIVDPAASFTWRTSNDQESDSNPAIFPLNPADSIVEVTLNASDDYCATSLRRIVNYTAISEPVTNLSNVITQNNDGINDSFCPTTLSSFESCYSLEVYNRWGKVVFSTDKINECWRPSNQSPGVYFYVINLGATNKTGSITIL